MHEFKVGDPVLFGRTRGQKTRGIVVKINPRSIKVRQTETRGTMGQHQAGKVWGVSPALVERDPTGGVAKDETRTVTRSLVQEAIDAADRQRQQSTDPLVGATVVRVRPMSNEEIEREYWQPLPDYRRPAVVELSDGSIIYPSCDPEGNGPGVLLAASGGRSYALCCSK